MSVQEKTSTGTVSLASGLSYDKVGNLLALTFGNGLVMQRGYDAANRLSGMTVPGILKWTYTRDHMGDITAVGDMLNSKYSEAFSYDTLYRLDAAQGPWGNQTYTYDANGNRLFEDENNKIAGSYAYTGNRLLSVSSRGQIEPFTYDKYGNITEDGDFHFLYDQSNHLAQVTKNVLVVGQYTYNGKGQRVVKKVPGSLSYTVFHYDLAGRLIEETDAKGHLIADYIYLGQNPLAMVNPSGEKRGSLLLP